MISNAPPASLRRLPPKAPVAVRPAIGGRVRLPHRHAPLRVGLLIPLSGPAGLWGPSCHSSATLAAAEINGRGGVLGREIELVPADAGGEPDAAAHEAGRLVAHAGVEAIVGMHISAVRQALIKTLGGRVPFVYTPLYEGGESSPGVFATGETPEQQLRPAIRWLAERRHVRRWYLIGNDYIWPRVSHPAARRYIAAAGGQVLGESYLPFGLDDYAPVLAALRAARPDAVLLSLVGNDAVTFNRAFAREGLAAGTLRLSAAIEENTLLGIGADNTENLYAAAGYFAGLDTPENMAFLDRYHAAFGERAPLLNALGQSCYEGLHFFHSLASLAGTCSAQGMSRMACGTLAWRGARGLMIARGNRAAMRIYLAKADGLEFRVVAQL